MTLLLTIFTSNKSYKLIRFFSPFCWSQYNGHYFDRKKERERKRGREMKRANREKGFKKLKVV